MSKQRIQLQRTKGWRKPPGAVKVARPAHWGNPFPVEAYGQDGAVKEHRAWLAGAGPGEIAYGRKTYSRQWVLDHLSELVGKGVACFCALDQRCHGDTLLAMAEAGGGEGGG